MLIPSIDLRNGQIVQLVQGRRLAFASDDVAAWVERFAGFPKVQVIDLDGAMEEGGNEALVGQVCRALPCRVGGGIRTIEKAARLLEGGAHAVIVGSSLFRDGAVDHEFAAALADAIGSERIIAAVDAAGGRVVIRGWRETTAVTPVEATRRLEPYCAEFLYTHVETEGLMGGIPMDAVRAVRSATIRRLTVAGGVTTLEEVDALDAMGIDAVVGMAIYTGRLGIRHPPPTSDA
jgi:phosphoribosylformimino-5-aminoimidazole carboxamide ribotide isomerase